MAQRTSRAAIKSGTARTPKAAKAAAAPKQRLPVALAPPSAAARSRINQRRRQQITRHVRNLEAMLPSLGGGVWRPMLPAWRSWGGWRWLRTRWMALLVLALVVFGGLAGWMHSDERWFLYREDAQFRGLSYLEAD